MVVRVGPRKTFLRSVRTVGLEPLLDLTLTVQLFVVGEDTEVVGEEGANDGGDPEGEDDLLLDSDGKVADSIVTSGNVIVLIQEGEVDGVPGGKQGNRDDE